MIVWQKLCLTGCVALLLAGCGKRETLVEIGNRNQELRLANEGEPSGLDPEVVTGNIEHSVMLALFEGLVVADSKTLLPKPGVAERWEVSPDGKIYTFYIRKNARWSNGDPLIAPDFVESYHRMLTPALGAQYSYMLYPVENAEAFNLEKIKDFSQVGFKALDNYTLQITLHSPTPYLPSMMIHDSWFPVPIAVIKKYGAIDDVNNPWTQVGKFVGNGPFILKEWKMNSHLLVTKSPTYWDAQNVRLNSIYFDPTEGLDTSERMFRSGQVHSDPQAPPSKIAFYKKYKPNLINIYPLLGTYFYKMNVKRPPLNDKRVREALAMSIDRRAITETIMRGGEEPAYFLTPPDTAGYTCQTKIQQDIPAARRLLAEAGYPDGKNFPSVEILFNTLQSHKAIAEAFQQMWKKNLNINVVLHNEEWKVYLNTMKTGDYYLGRFAWVGDYVDPSTFLDLFLTDSGNNETGWSNAEYDRLVHLASSTGDRAVRYAAYQKAEAILLDEMPILPIYFYTRPRLIVPSVKGWHPNLLDQYDFKSIFLAPETN